MTNAEKFKEVFGRELGSALRFDTSCSKISQIFALRSMYIVGVDCIEEWMNAEYKEQKVGKWMRVEWGKTLFGKKIVTYRCSRCAEYLDFKGLNCGRGRAWYCPNCGAKMEGEEE